VRDYVQQLTVEQFGAMVPTATTSVGDDDGLYLGYTTAGGVRRPVLYDVTAPPRQSRASAVLLAGTLGSGKTLAAQLIAYGAALRGSLVVDFDPKPDHGYTNLASLDGSVEVIELTGAAEQQGALDPLAVGVEELREELTVSYLLELLRDPPASWEHAIARAVRDGLIEKRSSQLDCPGGCVAIMIAEGGKRASASAIANTGFASPTGSATSASAGAGASPGRCACVEAMWALSAAGPRSLTGLLAA
jgi:hypothetical protein